MCDEVRTTIMLMEMMKLLHVYERKKHKKYIQVREERKQEDRKGEERRKE